MALYGCFWTIWPLAAPGRLGDLERFVNPTVKSGKCWTYDTSQGHTFKGGHFTVPIGGKPVSIELTRSYTFNWEKFGQFWFCELEGT
jgi:hypothetical protein